MILMTSDYMKRLNSEIPDDLSLQHEHTLLWLLAEQSMLLTLSSLAALSAAQCGATTFSVDLGNTYCPNARKQESIKTADECMKTCCTEGDDKCTTWPWCEPGAACASGFNAQPGALSRGSDLDVWHTPRFDP